VAARGGWAGACSECVVVVEGALMWTRDRFTVLAEVFFVVLPGKACAAASVKTPVRMTLLAMSQRLSR
jgi:hypothetical protein